MGKLDIYRYLKTEYTGVPYEELDSVLNFLENNKSDSYKKEKRIDEKRWIYWLY